MENFDSLFENPNGGQQNDQPFDKEAWAQRKQAERARLYETIDGMTDLTLSGPKALSDYLKMQSRLGRTSVANTLLVMAQKPDATYVAEYEMWVEKGRGVKKSEGKNYIKLFRQDKEYTRDDGTVAMGYKVDRFYDVSQTYGKPVQRRATLSMPIRSKLRALGTDTPVPVRVSDSVSQDIGALYSDSDNTVYAARNMDGHALFFTIARELARAEHGGDTFTCDCAANVACLRYGIPARFCDRISEEVSGLDTNEKRELLGSIREAACDIIERVDRNLYAERQQQKSQPER